jgi:hypothetical protein
MPDVMIDTIRTIDDIFIRMVEAEPGPPIDDAVEKLWTMLESGELRLVVDGDRLRVERFKGPQAERLLVACRPWPLVAARRRAASNAPARKGPWPARE